MAIFYTFTPLTAPKMKISKKWINTWEISLFYTSAPKLMIICYTVPEIWCVMDLIVIFSFSAIFTLLPPTAQKIKIQKIKKPPGDIIILHKCTKNYGYMLYCSWDMARDRCNRFSFWAIFLPFYPQNYPKNENIIKMTKDIIILHKCTKNH